MSQYEDVHPCLTRIKGGPSRDKGFNQRCWDDCINDCVSSVVFVHPFRAAAFIIRGFYRIQIWPPYETNLKHAAIVKLSS